MALDNADRAYLEKEIDSTITAVPSMMTLVRNEQYNKLANIKEPDDLALGFATGMIYGAFIEYFVTLHQREPTTDEISEANQVIFRRTREIKEAIFKCG